MKTNITIAKKEEALGIYILGILSRVFLFIVIKSMKKADNFSLCLTSEHIQIGPIKMLNLKRTATKVGQVTNFSNHVYINDYTVIFGCIPLKMIILFLFLFLFQKVLVSFSSHEM